MSKQYSKKIIDFKLVKVEKSFNQQRAPKYIYNLQVEGIDDILIIESSKIISDNPVGFKIKYKLNEDNTISDFELL